MWNLIKNYLKKDLKRTVGSDIQEIFSELSPEKVVYTKKLGGGDITKPLESLYMRQK